MQEENEYVQDEVVEQEENTTTDEGTESDNDSVTLSKAEYSKLKRQSMAYKAKKEAPKVEQSAVSGLSKEDIELTVLASQGIDSDLLNEMKILASLRGKSIIEMKNDPIILAMQEVKAKEEKARLAKLPASKGSGNVRQEKTFSTPLSKEDHYALWKANLNK